MMLVYPINALHPALKSTEAKTFLELFASKPIEERTLNELPLLPQTKVQNRRSKRSVYREYERVIPEIHKMEEEFIGFIFSFSAGNREFLFEMSYQNIYNIYSDKFKMYTEYNKRLKRYRYTVPNIRYFSSLYAPLEKEIKPNAFDRILRKINAFCRKHQKYLLFEDERFTIFTNDQKSRAFPKEIQCIR